MTDCLISFGRYRCIEKIGSGGMSDVYLCTDKNIGKKWAMKVIRLKKDLSSIAKSEITLLKSLDYTSFPRITDAFLCDDKICIVTDYIEGKTLSSIIKEEGKLPESLVYDYFLILIRALMYLHRLSPPILYLDMKPSNIMIKNDGSLQLIDFGIAQTILMKGRGYGSVGYSPPEQYQEDGRLDERSDIFSLGMTMYALLTGSENIPDQAAVYEHIKKDKSLDIHLKNIILRCIAYDMDERPYPHEVERLLLKHKKKEGSIRLAMLETAAVSVLFFGMIIFAFFAYRKYESRKYADEMLMRASSYMTDDGYSGQGLKIICAYIDGNFLDKKTAEYFTYEVARSYFEVQRDYVSARRYFERLSDVKYPEVKYYIRLCNALTGFENDAVNIKEAVSEFRAYNNSLKSGDIKQQNEEMLNLILKENSNDIVN